MLLNVKHAAAVSQSRRLAAVQAPVIPIVGKWTAETPGTISLGQGVVSYEPPAAAIEAARRFGGTLTDHRYGPVEGLPKLVEAIEARARTTSPSGRGAACSSRPAATRRS
jgi:aspartate/methionine/tyrosine aminotransferase